MKPKTILLLLCTMGCLGTATEYHVSPTGDDSGPGSRQSPFRTLQRAADVMTPGSTCFVHEGVYPETVRFTRSGTETALITLQAMPGEKVVITGADPVRGWQEEGGGVYSAPMDWDLEDGNQIFAAGDMLPEASWPSAGDQHLFHPVRAVVESGTESTIHCPELPGGGDAWVGARIWCAGGMSWISWSGTVTGYDESTRTLHFETPQVMEKWYRPKQGNLFALRGVRAAMDAPGEWWFDRSAKRLYLLPPEKVDLEQSISAKARQDVLDLSGQSHIHIRGLQFRAGGIRTDAQSSHLVFENLRGSYVSHSNVKDTSGTSGVFLLGRQHLLLNCDLGYSSGAVVTIRGEDHRIINNHIHHGGYLGLWSGTVVLSGRRILFSHNTVRHAGRDLISTGGLIESLFQYNDISDAGWLTADLGMTYGHNTDFANTVFRYNWVHDNHAAHSAKGIYFDHLSQNAIVHHNVFWNLPNDPVRVNNPSYGMLVFNNTAFQTGGLRTFDHSKRNDLFGSRFSRNIFPKPFRLPEHVLLEDNLLQDMVPQAPEAGDFRVAGVDPAIGAYAPNGVLWKAGADLENPPDPLPVYGAPDVPWMNGVRNAAFEFGTLEGWTPSSETGVGLTPGNGWGNDQVGKKGQHPTGTSKYELQLGPGQASVQQQVTGLSPNNSYTLSAWMRVSDAGQTATLRVQDFGGETTDVSVTSTEWTRRTIDFKTGPLADRVTLVLESSGPGHAGFDNLLLPLTPAGLISERDQKKGAARDF